MAARTVTADQRAVGPGRRLWIPAAVIALLAAHYALAYTATLGASSTFDEPLHMVAGVAYWTLEDYRLHPENGILPQRWCSLPLLTMGLRFPSLDSESWRNSVPALFGREYLYELGNDPERMLAAARAGSGLWSTALCLVVFLWSRSIFGTPGGLVSLALAAFWPAFVAHGPLATSDACGALFFTLGGWSLWLLCQRVSWSTIIFAFFSVGLAVIAKYTNILLGPLGITFVILTAAVGEPLQICLGRLRMSIGRRATRLAATLAVMVVPLAGAIFCIWAAYGFRYAAGSEIGGLVHFCRYESLANCNEHAGRIGVVCGWLERWRLLPEAWIYGLSYVAASVRLRNAFALGQYSTSGWWWYFPLCFAIKNTIPSLVLTAWGVAAAGGRIARGFRGGFKDNPVAFASLAPSAILVLLAVMLLRSAYNIGERHLLPLYSPLIVLAGAMFLGHGRDGSSRGQLTGSAFPRLAGVVILLALHATDVASRWPCSLAYFNQVVPRGREYRWLVDSNLDWGQDLRRLAGFVGKHARPAEPVYVDYFGVAEVREALPSSALLGLGRRGSPQRLQPGLYCISATNLASVYTQPFGQWCQKFEDAYRMAAGFVRELSAATATGPRPDPGPILEAVADWRAELGLQKLPADTPPEHVAIYAFNTLQAGRLRAFLRHREPDANVGGSFLVFRLSDADLSGALAGPPPELAARSRMETAFGGIAAASGDPSEYRFDLLEFRRLGGTVPAELSPLLDAESPPGPAPAKDSRP